MAKKWDAKYREARIGQSAPAEVLTDNAHLLPAGGDALEIACGLGANALLLAKHGLRTLAWDISGVVIDKLNAHASPRGLPLLGEVHDVETQPPGADSFDVIVVTRFLDRVLTPALVDALRPGGLLFYQTFIRDTVDDSGPSNPSFRLRDNELLELFADLRVLAYREEGRVGKLDRGFRNEAQLVGLREKQ